MMIQQITQRLKEVNTLLATCRQGDTTFEQAMFSSLFYKDFNDTNRIVMVAAAMFHNDASLLMDINRQPSVRCKWRQGQSYMDSGIAHWS